MKKQELFEIVDIVVDGLRNKAIVKDAIESFIAAQQTNVGGFLIPAKKDAQNYANGAFGFDEGADDKEQAFLSGYDWTIDWIKSKIYP